MIPKTFMFVLACAATLALSGCYTVRTSIVNKERVDQEIPGQPSDTPVKTRKVVVFEVIEKDKAQPVLAADEPQDAAASFAGSAVREDDFTLPKSSPAVEKPLAQDVPAAAGAAADAAPQQAYVVEKDDTLQKISKKFYGAYSQWTRIYDANRDIIKDPNFLKPGVTLTIPAPAVKEQQ